MTAIYIREVHSGSKCQHCKRDAADEKSLCPKHLRIARQKFAAWSERRRADGKCIRCDRASYKGQLRCKAHRAALATYCHDWYLRNKEKQAKYDKERKERWLAKGRCPTCLPHRKLTGGFRRCMTCRIRYRTAVSRVRPEVNA